MFFGLFMNTFANKPKKKKKANSVFEFYDYLCNNRDGLRTI